MANYEIFGPEDEEFFPEDGHRGMIAKYPWRDLEVGQFFFISQVELDQYDYSYRPHPPSNLMRQGYKLRTAKGYDARNDEPGLKVIRVN